MNDLLQEFKEYLKERIISPIIFSLIASAVIYNIDYILIILMSKRDIEIIVSEYKQERFSSISAIIGPLLMALFYLFIHPWISFLYLKYKNIVSGFILREKLSHTEKIENLKFQSSKRVENSIKNHEEFVSMNKIDREKRRIKEEFDLDEFKRNLANGR